MANSFQQAGWKVGSAIPPSAYGLAPLACLTAAVLHEAEKNGEPPTRGFQSSSSFGISLPKPDALAVRAEKSIVGSFLNNLPRKEISALGSWLLPQSGHIPAIFYLNPA